MFVCVCVFVCVCNCVCLCVFVCVFVCVCARARACVHVWLCVGGLCACVRMRAHACVSAGVDAPACESDYEVAHLRVRPVCVSTRGYSVVQVGRMFVLYGVLHG